MTPARLVALDLETTGFDVRVDHIIEFCLVELDSELHEVGRLTRRVNPGIPIPPAATQIHGIFDEDVRARPTFAHHAVRIQRLVQQACLVAYNADFDLRLLSAELRRHGQPGLARDHPRIDPYRIYRAAVPDQYRLSGAVRHYLRRPHDAAHSAEADIMATVEVLRRQVAARETGFMFVVSSH